MKMHSLGNFLKPELAIYLIMNQLQMDGYPLLIVYKRDCD
jgi:hypothetical protein